MDSSRKFVSITRIDYEKVLNNVTEAVIILQEQMIIFANQPAEKLFLDSRQQSLCGTSFSQFLDADALSRLQVKIHRCFFNNLSDRLIDLSIRSADNKIKPVEMAISMVDASDRSLVQLTINDISSRIAIEESLRQSEKLSVIGELSAGILHEVKNPLTSIKGFLQLMQKDPVVNRSYIKIILNEVEQIEKIAGELLYFTKPKSQHFEVQDLSVLVNESMVLFETQALIKQVSLELRLGDSEHLVNGDGTQLKQVFINLIKNAIEASNDGAPVTITLSSDESSEYVKIRNIGKEIPESMIKKLGKSFFTTKGTGTGLGLMVTYTIVHNHQGEISVKSTKSEGTSFLLTFPRVTRN